MKHNSSITRNSKDKKEKALSSTREKLKKYKDDDA